MPEPEQQEPPPQGAAASTIREAGKLTGGIFGWLLRISESKNTLAFIAVTLVIGLGLLVGWKEVQDENQRSDAILSSNEQLGQILSNHNAQLEKMLVAFSTENDKERMHEKYLADMRSRDEKDRTKAISQSAISVGILTKMFELRMEAVERGLDKLTRAAFPGKVLFNYLPSLFSRLAVAPMPRATSDSSCTGRSADASELQPPGTFRP